MVVSNLMRITKALPPPSEDSNLEAPLPVHKIRSTADILWDLSSLISESVHLVTSSSERLIAASLTAARIRTAAMERGHGSRPK